MGFTLGPIQRSTSSGGTTPSRSMGSLGSATPAPSGGPSSFGRIDLINGDIKVPELIGKAASAPGYIYDRPLAALNTIGKGSPTDKGFIDQAGDTIRNIPVLGDIASGVANVTGNTLNAVSGLPFAATNAWVATALSDNYGKADSDPVEGVAGGIMTFKNVGEMRQYYAERGWTPEDVAAIREGKKGIFDFQDKAVSTNAVLDLTGRMVLDPTNLLAIGAIGAVTKGAIKAATLGGRIAEGASFANRIDKLATGAKALDDAVNFSRAGYKSTVAGMMALRSGEVAGVTLGTMSRHLAMLSRGSSDFLRFYRKAAVATTGAQLGLQEMAKAGVLDNTPLSPIMETLYEAADRMANDKPLSSGQLFNLWAAVNFPVHSAIKDGLESTRKNGLGIGVGPATLRTPFFKRVSDIEQRVVEILAPGMSFKEGRARLIEKYGDEQTYLDHIEHAARSVVAETGTFTALMNQPHTTAEFLAAGEMNNRVLEAALRARIEEGFLSGKDVAEKMKESFTGTRSTRRDKETGSVTETTGRVHREWDPDEAIREWVDWSRQMRMANLASGATKGTNVVAGIMDGLMPKEHLVLAKALLKEIAGKDGIVPKARMDEFLNLFPALEADANDPGNFFARLRAADSGEYPASAAIQRIDKMLKDDPITMREYLYGQEQLEKRAEALKRNKGTVVDENGMPDQSLLPDMGDAAFITPTFSHAVRKKMGIPATTLEDALASRGGAARAIEDDIAAVVDESGFNVRQAVQNIVPEDGGLHSAIAVTLDSATDPGSLQLAAAISLKRSGSRSSFVYYSGTESLTKHNLTMNAAHVRFDLPNLSDAEKKAVVQAVADAFDGQSKVNDTAGVVHVFAKPGQEAAVQDLADAIEAIVGRDRLNMTQAPAWVQTVVNDMKGGNRGRLPDGSVSARGIFTAARGDLRLVNADRRFSERLVRVTEFDTASSAKATERRGVLGESRPGVTRGPESARTGGRVLGDDGRGVEPPLGPDMLRLYRGEGGTYMNSRKGGGWFTTDRAKAERYGDVVYVDVPNTKESMSRFVNGKTDDEWFTTDAAITGSASPLVFSPPTPRESPYIAAADSTLPAGEVIHLVERDMAYDAMTPSLKGDVNGGPAPLGGIPEEQLKKVGNLELDMRQYDPQYRLKLAPTRGNVGTYYAGQGDTIRDLILTNKAAGDLWYHKALKPAAKLWDAMFDPVKTSRLARESKQAFYRELLGATAHLPDDKTIRVKDIDSFLQTAHVATQLAKMGPVQLYSRAELLSPTTLAEIARGQWHMSDGKGDVFKGFTPEALEAIGGAQNIHKILDRAGSRFYRSIRDTALQGGKKGELGRLIDATYGPVRSKTAKGRNYLRMWYHAFRFTLDPRFHIMNHAEPDLLGLLRDGWSATRLGGARSDAAMTDAAMLLNTKGEQGLDRALDAMASGFLDGRHIEGYLAKSFEVRRVNSTRDVLTSIAENDPAMQALRRKFGGSVDEMIDGLEQSMYNLDNKGVKPAFLEEAFQGILDGQELRDMEPLLVRLYEQNSRIMDDVKAMYHGNTNRSNFERTLNSYFLYWPISYQLKATKWLFNVLTKESLGRKTNLGGAWYVNNLYEQHLTRLAHDESYQRMFVDNPDAWFLASMLLPITQFDLGVGFSRTSRYILSSAALATGNTEFAKTVGGETFAKNPGDAAILIFRMGPAYSIELARSVLRQMGDKNRDLVVPVN